MNDIILKVDVERLYQHVLKIEGIKHPIENPEKLNETADYILSEFQKYGLKTNEQIFKIDGSDFTFRNIEGWMGDDTKPELLITSHYDTVWNAPGANDNGSAVAAMLEAARVLATEKHQGNVRFISFTQEEFHPTLYKQAKDKGIELGIVDESNQYTTYHTQKMIKQLFEKANIGFVKGKPYLDSWKIAYKQIKDGLTDIEKIYCEYLIEIRSHITRSNWLGELAMVGSDFWVKKALEKDKKISGVINLETIGYTSKRKNSQTLPPLLHPIFFPSSEYR